MTCVTVSFTRRRLVRRLPIFLETTYLDHRRRRRVVWSRKGEGWSLSINPDDLRT